MAARTEVTMGPSPAFAGSHGLPTVEDWSFGGLRRTVGATGFCPWGSTQNGIEWVKWALFHPREGPLQGAGPPLLSGKGIPG